MGQIRMLRIAAALAFLASAALDARAQITVTGGVYIDSQGVLRSRDKVDSKLDEVKDKAKASEERMIYISLPKLLAEAKKYQEKGEAIPESLRYLGGMVKLQYIFVHPEEKDLVIAGRAEPFETESTYRPRGRISGRPVLQLDDLVVALRVCGPGARTEFVGCDLTTSKESADRIEAKKREIAPRIGDIGERKAAEMIAEAGGLQQVKYFGVGDETRMAMVCIEADYVMKQMSLGIRKSPIRKVQSYMEMAGGPQLPQRFAFECSYEALGVSTDGTVFELRGPSLKLVTSLYSVENRNIPPGEVSPAAKKFAQQFTDHFTELSGHVAAFADLANLSDLNVLAGLIARDNLHQKAGWDLSWAQSPDGFKVAKVAAPKNAQTLCTWRRWGDTSIFVSGGVAMSPVPFLEQRAHDDKGGLKGKAQRPEGDEWSSSKKTK